MSPILAALSAVAVVILSGALPVLLALRLDSQNAKLRKLVRLQASELDAAKAENAAWLRLNEDMRLDPSERNTVLYRRTPPPRQ